VNHIQKLKTAVVIIGMLLAACASSPSGVHVQVYSATVLPGCKVSYHSVSSEIMGAHLQHCGATNIQKLVSAEVNGKKKFAKASQDGTQLQVKWQESGMSGQQIDYTIINDMGDPYVGSFIISGGEDYGFVLSSSTDPSGLSAQITYVRVKDSDGNHDK